MSGKKKPRQPRWVAKNSLMLAATLAAPVDDETRAIVNAQRHMALVRFAEGNATAHDLTIFDFAAAIGRSLAAVGVGVEVLALAERAREVIDAARHSMKHGLGDTTPGREEYDTLQQLVALVDLQMQSMSRGEYERCQRSAIGALQRDGLFNPTEATA